MSNIGIGDAIKHKLGNVGIVKEIKIRGKSHHGYVVTETKTGDEYWFRKQRGRSKIRSQRTPEKILQTYEK